MVSIVNNSRKLKTCLECQEVVLPAMKKIENCGDVNYFCEDCDPHNFTCGIDNGCRHCEQYNCDFESELFSWDDTNKRWQLLEICRSDDYPS